MVAILFVFLTIFFPGMRRGHIVLVLFAGCVDKNVVPEQTTGMVSNTTSNDLVVSTTSLRPTSSSLTSSASFAGTTTFPREPPTIGGLTEHSIEWGYYHDEIRREILTDPSRSSYEKFQLFQIPDLIERLPSLTGPILDRTVAAIILVAGELVASATDDSTSAIVNAVADACDLFENRFHLDLGSRFDVPETAADLFRHVLYKFPLANLNSVCPHRVSNDTELAYAVFIHQAYREAVLGSREAPVTWTLAPLNDVTDEELFQTTFGSDFIFSENLARGIVFPKNVKRAWFDRIVGIIFTDSPVESWGHVIPNVPIDISPNFFKAVGRFLALTILEMEPVGSVFSQRMLDLLLGNISPIHANEVALCDGFHSLIPVWRLTQFFNASHLGAILVGLSISQPREFDIELPFRVDQDVDELKSHLVELAHLASGIRGIPIGNFVLQPVYTMRVEIADDDDENKIIVKPGGLVIISARRWRELIEQS